MNPETVMSLELKYKLQSSHYPLQREYNIILVSTFKNVQKLILIYSEKNEIYCIKTNPIFYHIIWLLLHKSFFYLYQRIIDKTLSFFSVQMKRWLKQNNGNLIQIWCDRKIWNIYRPMLELCPQRTFNGLVISLFYYEVKALEKRIWHFLRDL